MTTGPTLRIATFNILNGRTPQESSVDEARYADAIASLDADVLALQEVDRDQPRSGGADLTAIAADAMGAVEHRFEPVLQGTPRCLGRGHERRAARRSGVRHRFAQPLPGVALGGVPAAADEDAVAVPAPGSATSGVGTRGTASRPARRAGHAARPGACGHHPPVLPAVVQRPPAAVIGPPGGAARGADSPRRRPQPAPPSGCGERPGCERRRGVSPSRRKGRPCSSTTSWWPVGCTPSPAQRCRCRCRTTWPSSRPCGTTRRSGGEGSPATPARSPTTRPSAA